MPSARKVLHVVISNDSVTLARETYVKNVDVTPPGDMPHSMRLSASVSPRSKAQIRPHVMSGMNMYWLATPHRIAFGDFLISAGTSMSIDGTHAEHDDYRVAIDQRCEDGFEHGYGFAFSVREMTSASFARLKACRGCCGVL